MTRTRRRVPSFQQLSAWVLAASGLVLYVWAPMTVPADALRGPSGTPWWVPWIAPPLLYGLLLVGLPGLTAGRRVAGIAGLCALHAGLSLAVAPLVAALGITVLEPWIEGLWRFPAAPIIQLFAVPLVAFPLRDLLVTPSRRQWLSVDMQRTPTPPPLRTGRGWDDAGMHTVGGERLREESLGRQSTPDSRRARPEPTRPLAVPPAWPASTGTAPAPLRPTPTPPRARFEVPAAGPAPPAAPLPTIDTDVLVRPAAPPPPPPPPPPRVEAVITEPIVIEPAIVERAVVEPPRVDTSLREVPAPATPGAAGLVVEAVPKPAVGVGGIPAAPIAEPSSPPSPPAPPTLESAAIARALAPVGALEIEHQTLMGIGLHTACGPRLARAVVTNAAFRAVACLAESQAAEPVTQTTLRGAAGALVVTPLGPLAAGGPVLAVAIPQRGALALLEILALRVAAEYRATHAGGSARPAAAGTPAGAFREMPVPARVGALVRSLAAGGTLRPVCLEDAAGGLILHLLLEPDADAERLGRFASNLYRIMEVEAEPGGVGTVQSVVVRLGSQRVVVQPVAPAGGRSALLVAATATDNRPGLTRLQLERVAARLGGAPP